MRAMETLVLTIGNRNYSSWSLRAHLVLARSGLAFATRMLPIDTPAFSLAIGAVSPTRKVPALRHGDLIVWDSLAIAEYVAEIAPEATLWPTERAARAVARSVSAEMHAGFAALRAELPMNLRSRRRVAPSPAARADIERVQAIWRECRARFGGGGPFLFGRFTIAEAFFAPVVARFATYGVELGPVATAYADAIAALPEVVVWRRDAAAETEVMDRNEVGEPA
jgi:glutathione S-transferase